MAGVCHVMSEEVTWEQRVSFTRRRNLEDSGFGSSIPTHYMGFGKGLHHGSHSERPDRAFLAYNRIPRESMACFTSHLSWHYCVFPCLMMFRKLDCKQQCALLEVSWASEMSLMPMPKHIQEQPHAPHIDSGLG